MPILKIGSIDPAFANFGMAKMLLDLDTMKFTVDDLRLITTDKQSSKIVRVNSDDLRRAKVITKEFHAFVADCHMVFAEIPTGGQSARAVMAFGIAIGILAHCPRPLIQVQPSETKMATIGTRTASKEVMIEWATEAFPTAPWLTTGKGAKKRATKANEHLADAVATAHAGILTDQFLQVLSMWRSQKAMAA